MKPQDPVGPPRITLRPHPPERRLIRALARGEVAAQGFCCSCCCCLHSLGSLAGAAVGSFHPHEQPDPSGKPSSARLRDDEIEGPPGRGTERSAARSILACMYAIARIGSQGLIALVVFLPAVLLGGSVLTACIFASIPEVRRDLAAWARLGWITLGTVVGGGMGLLVMYLLFTINR
jgi:hypothetical protein